MPGDLRSLRGSLATDAPGNNVMCTRYGMNQVVETVPFVGETPELDFDLSGPLEICLVNQSTYRRPVEEARAHLVGDAGLVTSSIMLML